MREKIGYQKKTSSHVVFSFIVNYLLGISNIRSKGSNYTATLIFLFKITYFKRKSYQINKMKV